MRPLTFLIGENSAGKTTLLGCFHALFNNPLFHPRMDFDFNEAPYQMGAFDTIARRQSQKNEEAKMPRKAPKTPISRLNFSYMGNPEPEPLISKNSQTEFGLGLVSEKPKMEYMAYFARRAGGSEPAASRMQIQLSDMIAKINLAEKESSYHIKTSKKEKKGAFPKSDNPYHSPFNPFFSFLLAAQEQNPGEREKLPKDFVESLLSEAKKIFPFFLIDLAPVRSKPRRNYDNIIPRRQDPEGGGAPMLLMRLSQKKKKWEKFSKNLLSFGKAAGLFDDIKIEEYGHSIGGPFQIQFHIKGAWSNIQDTGYGISQALPILTDLFLSPPGSRLLLQQPEVHLHPRAQAALTSLFIESARSMGKSFLIETHSDYMVDRARIEIRKGNIPPDHVSLIYLEPHKAGSKVYNISFDKEGNFVNAPESYGGFFLKEGNALLGLDD